MRCKALSLIISTMLAAQMSVASYAQQAYQFGKCEVAPANREAALRSVYIAMPDGVKIAADVILPRDLPAETKLPAVLTQTRYWRATSVLIKKGHRIRVAIAGADKDTFVRLPAEGTPVITVALNKRHASFIDLPVVNTNQAPRLSLQPCEIPGVEGEARCGVHHVFEDRRARAGRTIPLFVAVLPALETPAAPDPLFVIAGGPGQAATSVAEFASKAFSRVRRHRDIVLVDLAGVGRSATLQCQMYRTAHDLVGDFYPISQVRACRDSLAQRTDLSRYTTPVLMDDLDEVRAALGYDVINIYGTSYGTRAALVYVRRHRKHVRSIVLKAVSPPTMRGVMHYARDTERSLQRHFHACAADAACATAFPTLSAELREVLKRADRGALRGSIPDPAGGPPVDLPISRGAVASTFFGLLQNSSSAVRLPLLVHTTFLGDTRPLVEAIVGYRRALDAGISFGMHLSVMCSEDAPRMEPARAAVADRGTMLGDYRVAQLAAACREWTKGDVPPDYAIPVRSDVPALLVSGDLDPNTNERWGEEAARYLSRATHVVIPNMSHGFSSVSECGANFIADFIAAASPRNVDFSCKDRVQLPPFALSAQ